MLDIPVNIMNIFERVFKFQSAHGSGQEIRLKPLRENKSKVRVVILVRDTMPRAILPSFEVSRKYFLNGIQVTEQTKTCQ